MLKSIVKILIIIVVIALLNGIIEPAHGATYKAVLAKRATGAKCVNHSIGYLLNAYTCKACNYGAKKTCVYAYYKNGNYKVQYHMTKKERIAFCESEKR